MRKIENGDLREITTYRLSGLFKCIYYPESVLELKELLSSLDNYKAIGNGSNLIICDSFSGVFVGLKYLVNLDICDNIVRVGAGFNLIKLASVCQKAGLSGLEFASGIPGSVGGAIYMNAGAYGADMASLVSKVWVLNDKCEVKEILGKDMNFGYRSSILKNNHFICIGCELCLKEDDKEVILLKMKDYQKRRSLSQPINYPSAGSVFKNPSGFSAGKLIEEAGLKGVSKGDAYVSLKHANFIINKGNATALDVLNLINLVKKEVFDKFGVELTLEQEILE